MINRETEDGFGICLLTQKTIPNLAYVNATAKTQWSFGCSVCSMVKKISVKLLSVESVTENVKYKCICGNYGEI